VGSKHVEIRPYMNKIETVTSVGFSFPTPRKVRKSDKIMFNSSHKDIVGNEQADFVYVICFVLVHFTKLAISRTIPRNVRFIYE
jgi:hypothetical protein